ncbi:MAG: S9 family peptidase [Flavobacteriaceae bacterium]
MNRICLLLGLSLGLAFGAIAQKKKITVAEIYQGAFGTETLDALRSMKNGKQYTLRNVNRTNDITTIDRYNYESQLQIGTLFSSKDHPELSGFSDYEFSDDESKIVLTTAREPIYRRSTLGICYVYDIGTEALLKVSDTKIQEPKISPKGDKLAYVSDNNMYMFDLDSGQTVQITKDGEKNKIINGVTDWVYEEEFSFVRAFEWNSDGTKIAFLRFDETLVPEFTMDFYGKELYPKPIVFKYPKAGEANSVVTLHLFDLASGKISDVDLEDAYYIPRIKWMNAPDRLSVQTINRHQNNLKLLAVNTTDHAVSLLLKEKDDAYVDIHDNLTFLEDDRFIWTSEGDGFNHIYLYGSDGKLQNQITKGPWEVTAYYGYDKRKDRVFYQSTENGSINRGIYSITSKGKNKNALASKAGTNSADFSADHTYFIKTYSSATVPPLYTLNEASTGKELKVIKDNAGLAAQLEGYTTSAIEFSTININGNALNMYMIKPKDFDATKKYPLLMYQYSGPGSQNVANRWLGTRDYWHQMLAQEGYVIACVDGRGTGFNGSDFKKVTYMNLVKYETEDQIAVTKSLSELPYIDPLRTGIWGWSFGGHMASNCILKGSDTFEMAIAVAPVTSWRFYDTIYTERYMRTPEENPRGYDDNSPFNYPELLKGKYLLVHGSGDDNVHVQNSMRMIEALVQANKPFDWAIYPDKNHGIYGGNTSIHLFNKMTDFIKMNL